MECFDTYFIPSSLDVCYIRLNPWFSEMCEVSGEDYVNCDEVVSQTSDNDIDTNEDDYDEVRSGPEDSQEY